MPRILKSETYVQVVAAQTASIWLRTDRQRIHSLQSVRMVYTHSRLSVSELGLGIDLVAGLVALIYDWITSFPSEVCAPIALEPRLVILTLRWNSFVSTSISGEPDGTWAPHCFSW